MLGTLTSKGQITLPKEIRDRLSLVAGSKLDFSIDADGSLRVRPLHRGAGELFGLLHDPRRVPHTVEEMNAAVGRHLAEDDQRIGGEPAKAAARRKAGR